MTSYLPQIGTSRVHGTDNGSRYSVSKQKLSLLELSQNVQNIREEKIERRFRAQSHDPSVETSGKENRKRKSTIDRSKSLGHGDQDRVKARRKYVFDVNRNEMNKAVISTDVPEDKTPNSADKRVRFDANAEEVKIKEENVFQKLYQPKERHVHAVGVQYKVGGTERNGVRLGALSPLRTSSPKQETATGSPKRSRSPYSPSSPKRNRQNEQKPGRLATLSPNSGSNISSPKGSRRAPVPGTHQARLEAARTRARIWAETYSDPGPAPSEKVLK